jgi:hypothetical protein
MDEVIDGDDTAQAAIGWPRAIVTAVLVVVIGIVLLAYGTNALLTKLSSLDRSQRVGVSTAYFFVVFGAIAFGLRRLQRRGSI